MKVVLAYKNFAANKNISHIGLGVAGINTCKTLIDHGVPAEVWPINSAKDLRLRIDSRAATSPPTHVVISAPWISTVELSALCFDYPHIQFAVNCHSNVGFLQADPNGVRLVREGLDLELSVPNFTMAANSQKMARWVLETYGSPCQFLPNLYHLNGLGKHHRPLWDGGMLRIGIFGATRPQKNFVSAIGAAVQIAHHLKAHCEIWISTDREEGGAGTILRAGEELVAGLTHISLRKAGWQSWPQFRRLVGTMNLLLQPSYTESFNMVTADGIVEGVPSVVSEAIDWAPRHWQANIDDASDMARVGRHLLRDHHAAHDGFRHLEHYVRDGIAVWKKWIQ